MLKPVYLKLAWETLKKNYRISVPFVLDAHSWKPSSIPLLPWPTIPI